MDGKKWYTSKTLWVAFLIFVASIAKLFGLDLPVDDSAAWMGIAISIIQAILRLITGEPVVIEKK